MSLTNPNKVVTEERLSEFYQEIFPYLGGASHTLVGGAQPIGSIIPFMGTVAPSGTLACDGTVYNIADYPDLANFFDTQFGQINKFGGNGTTTFAVPDLRGEFLRGTGTNSHTNQGNGDSVGTHQDATEMPCVYSWVSSNGQASLGMELNNNTASSYGNIQSKQDTNIKNEKGYFTTATSNITSRTTQTSNFTVRTTNTSILWCIQAVSENTYSTDEKIVDTWIDGKPIYQKTFNVTNDVDVTTDGTDAYFSVDIASANYIDTVVNLDSVIITSNSIIKPCYVTYQNDILFVYRSYVNSTKTKVSFSNNRIAWNQASIKITIQYTKTTD